MARPRIYDEPRVTTAIRVPAALHADLKEAAREQNVSVNALVTGVLRERFGRRASGAGVGS